MAKGSAVLAAIQTRLAKITEANGYSVTVKSVSINSTEPRLNTAEQDLPLLDVFNDNDDYDHDGGSSGLWTIQNIYLCLVAPKAWTDAQMEDWKDDIRKCLYADSPIGTGNTGMTLGGLIASIKLIDSTTDLNMIESNRMWIFRFQMRRHGVTYRD